MLRRELCVTKAEDRTRDGIKANFFDSNMKTRQILYVTRRYNEKKEIKGRRKYFFGQCSFFLTRHKATTIF